MQRSVKSAGAALLQAAVTEKKKKKQQESKREKSQTYPARPRGESLHLRPATEESESETALASVFEKQSARRSRA